MSRSWFVLVSVLAVLTPTPCHGASMWEDIASCIFKLSNDSDTLAIDGKDTPFGDSFSIVKIFTTICGNQDSFVRCLDNSLKHSNDGMARVIGSLFESDLIIKAYQGLCSNISVIEESGTDVFGCLANTKLSSCQTEMADYFFYMGLVKKLGAPSEQLSTDTVETLLCSLTDQRRNCEVQALRNCNNELGGIMDEFYRQTQPQVCRQRGQEKQFGADNTI